MANGSELAMAFIEANPNIAENTTITLLDTGGTVEGATAATNAAITAGAKLILGPLRGDSVTAAGAFPSSAYGQAQQTAFRQQRIAAGLNPAAVYTFSGPAEAQQIVAQALPLIKRGMIDALFLPDRATAPSFAALLAQAGVTPADVQIVGSADWDGDSTILAAPALSGALYPAVDPAGMTAIRADYQTRFNSAPHALTTIAYTATILANANT
ncbi:MAG: hypothetical protein MO852_14065, partial [Candidatus Devosia euplotis]|nr:hypothetical protein [Candidatus Devosia euplotis]